MNGDVTVGTITPDKIRSVILTTLWQSIWIIIDLFHSIIYFFFLVSSLMYPRLFNTLDTVVGENSRYFCHIFFYSRFHSIPSISNLFLKYPIFSKQLSYFYIFFSASLKIFDLVLCQCTFDSCWTSHN